MCSFARAFFIILNMSSDVPSSTYTEVAARGLGGLMSAVGGMLERIERIAGAAVHGPVDYDEREGGAPVPEGFKLREGLVFAQVPFRMVGGGAEPEWVISGFEGGVSARGDFRIEPVPLGLDPRAIWAAPSDVVRGPACADLVQNWTLVRD